MLMSLPPSFPAPALADRVNRGLKVFHSSSTHIHGSKLLGRKKFCFCSGSLHDFLLRTPVPIPYVRQLEMIPPSYSVCRGPKVWLTWFLSTSVLGLANSVVAAVLCYFIILEKVALKLPVV